MSLSPTAPMARIPLVESFAATPDPRRPRGVRHPIATILSVAAAAVVAGARSWTAVHQWMADTDRDVLSQLGIDPEAVLPSESTIRRALAGMDADGLDAQLGAWMTLRVGDVAGRRVIAVDGKSMRGAVRDGSRPHLLSVLDQHHGVVVGQQAVGEKSNEIPVLRELLATINITDVVVTADALHCQRESAAWIIEHGGHYVLTVKGNQPTILRQLKALPWKDVPAHTSADIGHGRRARRTVKAIEVPDWVDWPGAAQVVQVRRTRTIKGRKQIEVAYAICSVPIVKAQPRVVASWIQGHWSIENSLHWVRDVTFDEDRHQLRVGSGPQIMATMRNTAISLLRLAGWDNIAAGLRHHGHDSRRPVALLTSP